jgi:hypothetical protein
MLWRSIAAWSTLQACINDTDDPRVPFESIRGQFELNIDVNEQLVEGQPWWNEVKVLVEMGRTLAAYEQHDRDAADLSTDSVLKLADALIDGVDPVLFTRRLIDDRTLKFELDRDYQPMMGLRFRDTMWISQEMLRRGKSLVASGDGASRSQGIRLLEGATLLSLTDANSIAGVFIRRARRDESFLKAIGLDVDRVRDHLDDLDEWAVSGWDYENEDGVVRSFEQRMSEMKALDHGELQPVLDRFVAVWPKHDYWASTFSAAQLLYFVRQMAMEFQDGKALEMIDTAAGAMVKNSVHEYQRKCAREVMSLPFDPAYRRSGWFRSSRHATDKPPPP